MTGGCYESYDAPEKEEPVWRPDHFAGSDHRQPGVGANRGGHLAMFLAFLRSSARSVVREEIEGRMTMGLLERVSTLIRANINDMVDRAEDPEKMIKQVILDMENQYLQVKTQVAVSIADQHILEKKQHEQEDTGKDWMRKAEIAVDKKEDDLARSALDRYQTSQRLAQSFQEQVNDQKAQVESLKTALLKLEQKLDEAKAKRELLLARHRRSIALDRATRAQVAIGDGSKSASFDRLKDRVNHTEATATAELELITDDVADRLNRLDRDSEVERLLSELKTRRSLPPDRQLS